MSFFPNALVGDFGDEKKTGTTKKVRLGTRMILPDGSVFYYASGGAAIGAGHLCMVAAGDASADMDLTVSAITAVGSTTVTVDVEAGAIVKNAFADGYLYINDGGGEGHKYRIKSHPASAGGVELVVTLAESIVEALALDTSLAGLMANPYSAVLAWDVDGITGPPVGVWPCEIASGSYGWIQTWGWAPVLSGAVVPVLGSMVMPADTAADDGSVELRDAATLTPAVGWAGLIAPVDTDYGMVFLRIAP